jgi:hypothetical protein
MWRVLRQPKDNNDNTVRQQHTGRQATRQERAIGPMNLAGCGMRRKPRVFGLARATHAPPALRVSEPYHIFFNIDLI